MIGVEVKSNRFAQFRGSVRERVRDAIHATAAEIDADAKQRVPVDTGNLRRSIQYRMTGDDRAIVEVTAEYAAFVEYGTVNMAAQPYLTPASEVARATFNARMRKII